MQNRIPQETTPFSNNAATGLFSDPEILLARELISDGQSHLFSDWDEPGVGDHEKRRFMAALLNAHLAYPGGLTAYTRNARLLLAEAASGANPFEGCTPAQPDLVDLSSFGPDYDAAEAEGLKCFADSAVVLVAGGLGERLGYHGIKLDIPVEVKVEQGTAILEQDPRSVLVTFRGSQEDLRDLESMNNPCCFQLHCTNVD